MCIKIEDIINNSEIKTYIQMADKALEALGYTEHSFAHVKIVSDTVGYILSTLGFDEHTVELGKIAGYLHDIGNIVNRINHSQSGAIISFKILDHLGMSAEDISQIVMAIGNHDEGTGTPISPIAAALILADKADVRRTRVRNQNDDTFDIHDRVNYSVKESCVKINTDHTIIKVKLSIDTHYCSVMDFFEIFMERMILCKKAAEKLGLRFKLIINEQQLI
ncbi:MAG: HD domain-containing protein [Treponema sp.]|nr:HD domain-containing protein [Treponema sp.]